VKLIPQRIGDKEPSWRCTSTCLGTWIPTPSHLDNKLLEIQIHGQAFVMMSKEDITFKEYLHAPKLPKK